jgi:hypothetical protein
MKTIERIAPAGYLTCYLKGVDTVVFYRVLPDGHVCAAGYAGRATNPTFNYSFRTAARFAEYLREFRDGRLQSIARKAERKATRDAFVHNLAIGDVLKSSWGYEQTNVDYYEVTKVCGKHVEVKSIGKHYEETAGNMSGRCYPLPGTTTGEATRHLVGSGNSIKVRKWGCYASKITPRVIAGAKIYDSAYESHYA